MIARTRCQRILAALILSLLPAPACATATDGRLLFAAIFTSLGSGARAQTSHVFADRAELLVARDAWCANPTTASATYGPIGTWDVTAVTDMSLLFCTEAGAADGNADCVSFNEDLGNWDVSSVTNMRCALHAGNFCPRHDP